MNLPDIEGEQLLNVGGIAATAASFGLGLNPPYHALVEAAQVATRAMSSSACSGSPRLMELYLAAANRCTSALVQRDARFFEGNTQAARDVQDHLFNSRVFQQAIDSARRFWAPPTWHAPASQGPAPSNQVGHSSSNTTDQSLSGYEKERLARIDLNNVFLVQLGLRAPE